MENGFLVLSRSLKSQNCELISTQPRDDVRITKSVLYGIGRLNDREIAI